MAKGGGIWFRDDAVEPTAQLVAEESPPAEQPTQPAQQGATFESLDADSDGRISKTEAAVNANVTAQFTRYDKNGNGFIEKEEVTVSNSTPPAEPAKP